MGLQALERLQQRGTKPAQVLIEGGREGLYAWLYLAFRGELLRGIHAGLLRRRLDRLRHKRKRLTAQHRSGPGGIAAGCASPAR